MPLSSNIATYEDCRRVMDQALEAERGIRVTLSSKGQAVHFRQRCYKFRTLDRERSHNLYPQGDPRRNTSVYDVLKIDLAENFVLIVKLENASPIMEVEEL